MIANNLANVKVFHEDSPQFIKYFREHQRNAHEEKKVKELSSLILSFYQKVFTEKTTAIKPSQFFFDVANCGYLEDDNCGYYTIHENDWHKYVVISYGEDIDGVFLDVANEIINLKADNKLYKHRKEINNSLKKRFKNINNYEDIFYAEYALNKWDKYFDGNIPKRIIAYYEFMLNMYNNSFKYDPLKKEIVIKHAKKRKLTK